VPETRFRSKEDLHVIHSLGEWFRVRCERFDNESHHPIDLGVNDFCAIALAVI